MPYNEIEKEAIVSALLSYIDMGNPVCEDIQTILIEDLEMHSFPFKLYPDKLPITIWIHTSIFNPDTGIQWDDIEIAIKILTERQYGKYYLALNSKDNIHLQSNIVDQLISLYISTGLIEESTVKSRARQEDELSKTEMYFISSNKTQLILCDKFYKTPYKDFLKRSFLIEFYYTVYCFLTTRRKSQDKEVFEKIFQQYVDGLTRLILVVGPSSPFYEIGNLLLSAAYFELFIIYFDWNNNTIALNFFSKVTCYDSNRLDLFQNPWALELRKKVFELHYASICKQKEITVLNLDFKQSVTKFLQMSEFPDGFKFPHVFIWLKKSKILPNDLPVFFENDTEKKESLERVHIEKKEAKELFIVKLVEYLREVAHADEGIDLMLTEFSKMVNVKITGKDLPDVSLRVKDDIVDEQKKLHIDAYDRVAKFLLPQYVGEIYVQYKQPINPIFKSESLLEFCETIQETIVQTDAVIVFLLDCYYEVYSCFKTPQGNLTEVQRLKYKCMKGLKKMLRLGNVGTKYHEIINIFLCRLMQEGDPITIVNCHNQFEPDSEPWFFKQALKHHFMHNNLLQLHWFNDMRKSVLQHILLQENITQWKPNEIILSFMRSGGCNSDKWLGASTNTILPIANRESIHNAIYSYLSVLWLSDVGLYVGESFESAVLESARTKKEMLQRLLDKSYKEEKTTVMIPVVAYIKSGNPIDSDIVEFINDAVFLKEVEAVLKKRNKQNKKFLTLEEFAYLQTVSDEIKTKPYKSIFKSLFQLDYFWKAYQRNIKLGSVIFFTKSTEEFFRQAEELVKNNEKTILYEIAHILLFKVRLFFANGDPNLLNEALCLSFKKAIQSSISVFFKSDWANDLRHAAVVDYANHFLGIHNLKKSTPLEQVISRITALNNEQEITAILAWMQNTGLVTEKQITENKSQITQKSKAASVKLNIYEAENSAEKALSLTGGKSYNSEIISSLNAFRTSVRSSIKICDELSCRLQKKEVEESNVQEKPLDSILAVVEKIDEYYSKKTKETKKSKKHKQSLEENRKATEKQKREMSVKKEEPIRLHEIEA